MKTAKPSRHYSGKSFFMAIPSKYVLAIFVMWFGSYSWTLTGQSSILKTVSLSVGILLGLITIVSKLVELFKWYHEKTIRDEIRTVIEEDEIKPGTEESLEDIVRK